MPTDPTRLRGDGVPITLADGSIVELRYDFDALCELEEMFGTLHVFTARLAAGGQTKFAQTIAKAVTAGLRHLDAAPDVDAVKRMLDSRRLGEYQDAVDEAFVRAMPEAPEAAATDPKAGGETSDSPGTTSTTSQPSPLAEPIASSGA